MQKAVSAVTRIVGWVLVSAFVLITACGGGSRAASATTPTSGGKTGAKPPLFSGAKAFTHLKKQVGFGYRIPGTSAHEACVKYIIAEMTPLCGSVNRDDFNVPLGSASVPLTNIIAVQNPSAGTRILLCAHYDTRPRADQDVYANRGKPIPGANDGASGVAVLIELARVFKALPPNVGIEYVFFDGEDYGATIDTMLLGSRYFAAELTSDEIASIKYGLLFDMVGEKDLTITAEQNSMASAPDVYADLVDTAKSLGYHNFSERNAVPIEDDHTPLINAGVKMVDIIGFDYPYWHTIQDTVDKCSAESLAIVGRTAEMVVRKEE